jgi:transcriptional regulator
LTPNIHSSHDLNWLEAKRFPLRSSGPSTPQIQQLLSYRLAYFYLTPLAWFYFGLDKSSVFIIWIRHMWERSMTPEVEWKKVSAELLILSLVEARPRHGYEISKLIEQRSNGAVRFYVASLYPLLYRLEKRGWIQGRWVEKSGQRRRRYYRLTSDGEKVLASQRRGWRAFVEAVNRITEAEHA